MTDLPALRREVCQNCSSKSRGGVLNLSLGKFDTPQSSEQDYDDDDDDDNNDDNDNDNDDDNGNDYNHYYH